MNKKLVGPYKLHFESNLGFQNTENLEIEDAGKQAAEAIAKWKYGGYLQVKEGAYLFSWGQHWRTVQVWSSQDKLVTKEVLDFFEEKMRVKEGRK